MPTRRDSVFETMHGHVVSDPYRWLENDDGTEVEAWIDEQNARTDEVLGSIEGREMLRRRLQELLSVGDVSRPAVTRLSNGHYRYFYTRRAAGQEQPRLLARDEGSDVERVVLDPNQWSASGTLALDWYYPSLEGSLVAYGVSESGSESSTLKIYDIAAERVLDDAIVNARHAGVCWKPGGAEFFYGRHPKPGDVPAGEEGYYRRIYAHHVGTAPEQDSLIFGEGLPLTDYPSCALSPDGRWLVIIVHFGWTRSDLYLADATKQPITFSRLTDGRERHYSAIVENDVIYVFTNDRASRYRVVAVDPTKPARDEWRTVLPEHPVDVLEGVAVVGNEILATYLSDGATRLHRYTKRGDPVGPVALPTLGSSNGFVGHPEGSETFYDFESFAHTRTIFRLDLTTGETTEWARVPSPVNAADFTVTRGHAVSADGTQIPYVAVRRGSQTGPSPTLLYGYGGFNLSLRPQFARATNVLLERGGTYVQANLRGGGEFGDEWHRAGRLANKQRVFDDFIAVAEHLVTTGVTRRETLAILGRSNGGLLVAAAITQRPHLFRAAVASVPLTDMIRYHHFLLGKLWIAEYGSPEEPDAFDWLYRYSPYHHVRSNAYPATFLTTARHDTRVHPMHARKFAAALQEATSSGLPVLLRSEPDAGHGVGKPVSLVIDEYVDVYAFVLWQLGLLKSSRQPT